MSSIRRQAAQENVIGKLSAIKALWFTVNNDPRKTVHEQAGEFFFLVGLLFEGVAFENLTFKQIDRNRALRQLGEG